jgi:hypothetical protein
MKFCSLMLLMLVCSGLRAQSTAAEFSSFYSPEMNIRPSGDMVLRDATGKVLASRTDGIVRIDGKPEEIIGLILDMIIKTNKYSMDSELKEHARAEACFAGWKKENVQHLKDIQEWKREVGVLKTALDEIQKALKSYGKPVGK